MENGLNNVVDFYLKTCARDIEYEQDLPTCDVTVRLPWVLKVKLDVIAEFLSAPPNELITEFLEASARQAELRLIDNPYLTIMTVNNMTFDEAV